MNIALKIKKIRKDNKISQTQFAKDLGISRGALVNYERGVRTPPVNLLLKISEKFNIDIDSLTADDKDENLYTIKNEDALILKESNIASKYINTESNSIDIKNLTDFLHTSGYPIDDLSEQQIAELHKNAKEFFNYEFFKLGYIKVLDK